VLLHITSLQQSVVACYLFTDLQEMHGDELHLWLTFLKSWNIRRLFWLQDPKKVSSYLTEHFILGILMFNFVKVFVCVLPSEELNGNFDINYIVGKSI